jgi:pimeloyl-ACP methyl ester carboxylesterase
MPPTKEIARNVLRGTAGLGMGAIAWSALAVNHRAPLPAAIAAHRRAFETPTAGRISFYFDEGRGGRPVLLIHSVGLDASAREVQPLFDYFRGETPIYAPDLPGFGFSSRANRVYSPELYATVLIDLIKREIAPPRGGVDTVALSVSCEFAALAASRRPELFRSLVLIAPTGFDGARSGGSKAALGAISFPVWSQAVFDLLVSRPAIRRRLNKSFAGPIDADLAEYSFLSAHQPGARYAPFYYLSGKLVTPEIRRVYASVAAPVLAIVTEDAFPALPDFTARHSNWLYTRIAHAKSLPHFDNAGDTMAVLASFWRRLPEPAFA